MGRYSTGRAPTHEEIISHAAWVYEETLWLDINAHDAADKAFRAAIEAALNKAYQGFKIGVVMDLLEEASDLDESEDDEYLTDGVAALLAFAKKLDDSLPEEYRLESEPNEHDGPDSV